LTDWKFIARKYLKWKRRFEPGVWKYVRRIHGTNFIDVGANKGLVYTLPLYRHFHRTYAIEPHPSAAAWLRSELRSRKIGNDADWANVEVEEFAASDMTGETDLFVNSGIGGMCDGSADTILPVFSYRPPSNPQVDMTTIGIIRNDFDRHKTRGEKHFDEYIREQKRRPIRVMARRLDDWWGEAVIDLMKIDVEGAEFNVLMGANRILLLVKNVVVELHDRERRRELEKSLEDSGFSVSWMDADHILGKRQ